MIRAATTLIYSSHVDASFFYWHHSQVSGLSRDLEGYLLEPLQLVNDLEPPLGRVSPPDWCSLLSCFSCCSVTLAWCNASLNVLAEGRTFSCHNSLTKKSISLEPSSISARLPWLRSNRFSRSWANSSTDSPDCCLCCISWMDTKASRPTGLRHFCKASIAVVKLAFD